ncbi:hypothetical protein MXL46_11445 [Heyndrickxia sporothermodurans]|uniref:Uncharacterized protein n=2 Tax=Siminovitchia TaxID=2837510 RepID=A0A429X9U3_SIMTE|nr:MULTISPECIES: hypothetical protein [Bacillaceae]MBM7715343.1 hypothetical protein [Siminovitchia thermophila]MEB6549701.1 hypothetical protein [Heyndrickxia sporothermodurans]RST60132.1 hypothetical protein D5F11_008720 [Siminovitchia terrae]
MVLITFLIVFVFLCVAVLYLLLILSYNDFDFDRMYNEYRRTKKCKKLLGKSYVEILDLMNSYAHKFQYYSDIKLINDNGKKIDTIINLFEKDMDVFHPLMDKYEHTFRTLCDVLQQAEKKELIFHEIIHLEIKELLQEAFIDFMKMDALLEQNKKLEENMEIEILTKSLKEETKMLKDMKKFKEGKL